MIFKNFDEAKAYIDRQTTRDAVTGKVELNPVSHLRVESLEAWNNTDYELYSRALGSAVGLDVVAYRSSFFHERFGGCRLLVSTIHHARCGTFDFSAVEVKQLDLDSLEDVAQALSTSGANKIILGRYTMSFITSDCDRSSLPKKLSIGLGREVESRYGDRNSRRFIELLEHSAITQIDIEASHFQNLTVPKDMAEVARLFARISSLREINITGAYTNTPWDREQKTYKQIAEEFKAAVLDERRKIYQTGLTQSNEGGRYRQFTQAGGAAGAAALARAELQINLYSSGVSCELRRRASNSCSR